MTLSHLYDTADNQEWSKSSLLAVEFIKKSKVDRCPHVTHDGNELLFATAPRPFDTTVRATRTKVTFPLACIRHALFASRTASLSTQGSSQKSIRHRYPHGARPQQTKQERRRTTDQARLELYRRRMPSSDPAQPAQQQQERFASSDRVGKKDQQRGG